MRVGGLTDGLIVEQDGCQWIACTRGEVSWGCGEMGTRTRGVAMARKPAGEFLEGECFVSGDCAEGGKNGLFFRLVWVGVDGAGVI